MSAVAEIPAEIRAYREKLGKTFPEVEAVFPECMADAMRLLSKAGCEAYIEGARFLGSLGRGAEPMLVFLEEAPQVAAILGEEAIGKLKDFAYRISRTPNGNAIVPFLQTAAAAARRLEDIGLFDDYLQLVEHVMQETTTSVHGIVATHSSPSLVDFLKSVPTLLNQLPIGAMKNWVGFGIRSYRSDPEGQSDYFALQSTDAHTMLQRERRGTLLVDHVRLLDMYLAGMWKMETTYRPYSLLFDEIRKPQP
ncbi:MAG: hypothetical protein Q9M29_09765, partial [Mariprofundaceae bacterium]|nr:hypothetical protein [Mariprofundaceae bacterium]